MNPKKDGGCSGLAPSDTPRTFFVPALLLVPVSIYGFGLLGGALLTQFLRVTGLTPWFERHAPKTPTPHDDRARTWVQRLYQRRARRDDT